MSTDDGVIQLLSDCAVESYSDCAMESYTPTDYLPASVVALDRRDRRAGEHGVVVVSRMMTKRVGFKINTLAAVSRRAATASTVRDASCRQRRRLAAAAAVAVATTRYGVRTYAGYG